LPELKTAAYTRLPSGVTASALGVSPKSVRMASGAPPRPTLVVGALVLAGTGTAAAHGGGSGGTATGDLSLADPSGTGISYEWTVVANGRQKAELVHFWSTVEYVGSAPNLKGKSRVVYKAKLPAGHYTIAIGGNPPSLGDLAAYPLGDCDPVDPIC
jgi:hypothetical protein